MAIYGVNVKPKNVWNGCNRGIMISLFIDEEPVAQGRDSFFKIMYSAVETVKDSAEHGETCPDCEQTKKIGTRCNCHVQEG